MPEIGPIKGRILLARMDALNIAAPPSDRYTVSSNAHHEWVGKVQALVNIADPSRTGELDAAVNGLYSSLTSTQQESWGKIFRIISRVKTALELSIEMSGETRDQAFGPGAVYDFFRALSEVIRSAKSDLLIADPYMDASIFDTYVASAQPGVGIRLLITHGAPNVRAAAEAFKRQHHANLEVRRSGTIHDRVVFVDGLECWVLGQSINVAATRKPTYLAPLASDVSQLKLTHYNAIWSSSS